MRDNKMVATTYPVIICIALGFLCHDIIMCNLYTKSFGGLSTGKDKEEENEYDTPKEWLLWVCLHAQLTSMIAAR